LVLEPLAKLSWKTMPAWAFATRPVQQTIAAVSLIVMERTCSDLKKAPEHGDQSRRAEACEVQNP
jgi:hypothetical protein